MIPTMEFRVGYNYRLGKRISSGAFGEIYLGIDLSTSILLCSCILTNRK